MKNRNGFTLIEIVILIVVLGIAMLPILIMYANVVVKSTNSQVIRTASMLGQDLMEEILSKRYDENEYPGDGPPWTQKRYLGCSRDGEDPADKSEFDDVDDFIDWAPSGDIYFTDFDNYTAEIEVFYVEPEDLDTEAAIGNRRYTDFKRIKITIKYNGDIKLEIVSLMQGY